MGMKKSIRRPSSKFDSKKKETYFKEKLKENIANPKKLWRTLKQLGLPKKAIVP